MLPIRFGLSGRTWAAGDLDPTGLANLSDFNVLAANFGQGDRIWQTGDFNRDGVVNLADFNLLAASGPEVIPEDWSRLAAVVPEPAAATPALLMTGMLLARR